MAPSYMFSDALPQRHLTRVSVLLSVSFLFGLCVAVGIGLWQEILPGMGEYEIAILGRTLSARQTLMSSCFTGAFYCTQFIYRGLSSNSRLMFVAGIESCRLPLSYARFVMATMQAAKKPVANIG